MQWEGDKEDWLHFWLYGIGRVRTTEISWVPVCISRSSSSITEATAKEHVAAQKGKIHLTAWMNERQLSLRSTQKSTPARWICVDKHVVGYQICQKNQETWIKYVSHFAAWQENLCPSGFARKAGDLTGSLSKQTHFVKKCTYMFWKCSAVAKWYYILLMNTMWFSKPLFIIIVTLTSLHSCTNYSASSKYLCCIFEIRFTMKILVKRITATRKTFLWWLLALLFITVIHSMGVIRKLTESLNICTENNMQTFEL